ncbi:MAG: hypothetical protein J6O53_00440 [Eubacterium sp.]|nr:hypothetical protein [Eubacterium sp.]
MEYKCQNCGGSMEFDSASQKLICPYCGAAFDPAAYDAAMQGGAGEQTPEGQQVGEFDETQQLGTVNQQEWNVNEDGLMSYICKNCGGEVVGDDSLASTNCPYCDSPIIRNDQFAGMLKPELLIPFKVDKKTAKEKLNEFISSKKLVPAVFKDQKHIDEIKGVYVPFWLFDADVFAEAKFNARRTHARSNGEEIEYFDVYRSGDMSFRNIPADAASKMEDAMMDSIEPFEMEEAVNFSTAYLAGFMADKYDVSPEDCMKRGLQRIKSSAEEALSNEVNGFDYHSCEASNVVVQNSESHYALLPVWILNTTWNGNQYRFAMNGQTGKFIGDLPYDKSLYWKYFLRAAIPSVLIIFAILFFVWWIR